MKNFITVQVLPGSSITLCLDEIVEYWRQLDVVEVPGQFFKTYRPGRMHYYIKLKDNRVFEITELSILAVEYAKRKGGRSMIEKTYDQMLETYRKEVAKLPPPPPGYYYGADISDIRKEGERFICESQITLKPKVKEDEK